MEEELYEENYGLILAMAHKYRNSFKQTNGAFMDFDDLTQIAGWGLINAIRTYDESTGFKFGTYASKCMLNSLNTELKKNKRLKNYDENKSVMSLQLLVSAEEPGTELENIIGEDDNNYTSIEYRQIISQIIEVAKNILKEEEFKLWLRHIYGESANILSDELGIKRTTMTMRLKSYKIKVVEAIKRELNLSMEDII